MAKSAKQTINQHTGLTTVVTYFILFAVTSLIVYLASLTFPNQIVLGTGHITTGWALVHAIGTLTLINIFAIPFVHLRENQRGRMFTPQEWMGAYFVINFVGLWIVARFAEQLGLGISAWWVAGLLAIILDLAQGIAMMQVEKIRPRLA